MSTKPLKFTAGLTSSYDYGPLGAELLHNIRGAWWREMIQKRRDMVGLDSQILLHPQTWVASGHVEAFTDPLVDDRKTNKRYRADHLIEAWQEANQVTAPLPDEMTLEEMAAYIAENNILSPEGNPVTPPKAFNILFETAIGAIAGEKQNIYMRGETAQGIFSNFKNILDSSRVRLPFGVGQIGKSFRNEITTGQFVFRTLEFEQAEVEYFFDPEQTEWRTLFEAWQQRMWAFVTETLGVNPDNLRWRRHSDAERSHYSLETYDLDYRFPFGFKELWGIAYRTNYDLQQHIALSGQKLSYQDPYSKKWLVPHVIEPSVGINRLFLMLLADAYWDDVANKRKVLKLKPSLAPYKTAVFPLLKNKPDLVNQAETVFELLAPQLTTTWDDRGNIGKRYYYQDEIGTPFCVTIDFQTLDDQAVTVRHRDTAQQERVNISQLLNYLHAQEGM